MGNGEHIEEAISLAEELATKHFWEWLFRFRADRERERVQYVAYSDQRREHLLDCYVLPLVPGETPKVRPGREGRAVLGEMEVDDVTATTVMVLDHLDEMRELHKGGWEAQAKNAAELEGKYHRLEHLVKNYLPVHLGKVPRLDSQHTADTFADMFRDLLGYLLATQGEAGNGGTAAAAPVAVTTEEATIIRFLSTRSGRTCVNAEIEAGAELSKATVSKYVNTLIDKKLAHRPDGERKGVTLTAEGLRFAKGHNVGAVYALVIH